MDSAKLTTDAERREKVMQMRVIDDTFFERYIADPGACEELVQTVLDNPKIRIKSETLDAQKSIHFVANRSVRVDAYVEDDKDIAYNIEIQRFDNGNHVKRVRYNASAITVYGCEPGDTFDDVKNVIVIYISDFDLFAEGRAIYHVRNTIRETGIPVDDGLQMVYVNAKCIDGTAVSRLMQLYKKSDFEDKDFPRSSARMYKLKHDEQEVRYMCEIVKELESRAAKAAAYEAAKTSAEKHAKKLIKLGKLSLEEIAKCVELPLEEVQSIAEGIAQFHLSEADRASTSFFREEFSGILTAMV